ncbi:hypothetical protein BDF14DRAFT_1882033 [Spinellus fusiger]|nr:hypothetical protein BDF14DRAFT_1882033 [Spinellus fusiger]
MNSINALLEETSLASLKESGLFILSIVGNGGCQPFSSNNEPFTNITAAMANKMVGQEVFVPRQQPLKRGTMEVVSACQLYVDKKAKIVYVYLDTVVTMAMLLHKTPTLDEKSLQEQLREEHLITMRGLLVMLLVSHLMIPILPPSVLPAEFLSTLATLGQVKQGIYTHLAQLQSACWKCWDISVPNALFERREGEFRRERERFYPNLMGWWGPAKGVPLMVFVAAKAPIPNIDTIQRANLPMAIKRYQEALQIKIKSLFQSMHLVPAANDNSSGPHPIEVRSLFALPTTPSFIHVVPALPMMTKTTPAYNEYTFDACVYATHTMTSTDVCEEAVHDEPKDTKPMQSCQSIVEDCGDKLLRNFVTHWIKATMTRHPMHSHANQSNSRKGHDTKNGSVPLPNALQFVSVLVPLRSLVYGSSSGFNHKDHDFKKAVMAQSSGAKGMIQQIEVILRKKMKDVVNIEDVFSKRRVITQWK